MDIFEDKILPLFEQTGKSDMELERDIGLPRSIIYDWKSGRSKSYKNYIAQIANYFGVDTSNFIDGNNNKTFRNGAEKLANQLFLMSQNVGAQAAEAEKLKISAQQIQYKIVALSKLLSASISENDKRIVRQEINDYQVRYDSNMKQIQDLIVNAKQSFSENKLLYITVMASSLSESEQNELIHYIEFLLSQKDKRKAEK